MTENQPNRRARPINVVCVHSSPDSLPMALGMCLAYARRILPADMFRMEPCYAVSPEELDQRFRTGVQNVLLCSNYLWDMDRNLGFSRRAKSLDPECLVVHGGPNTPGYTRASEDFLRRHPEVDFIVVGEGELSLVELLLYLAGQGNGLPDGVGRLENGGLARHSNRKPVKDPNQFPSPYLEGMFDRLDPETCFRAAIETNRGCPYSCAYCSWSHPLDALGQHRVRLFDLERVREEINWVAQKGLHRLFITDSNFGHFERDLDIAEMVLQARLKYGFPRIVTVNYAKNRHEYILKIVEILEKKKMLSDGGIISLQTRDPKTLAVIKRKNIRTEEYDRLKEGFTQRDLPLNVQLMMGLPGATPGAFMEDLRYYFNQNLETTIFRTILLPNSPMADPEYLNLHRIEVDENNLVTSTAATSAGEMEVMLELGCLFDAAHNLGVLRLPLLWLSWEKGLDAIDILHQMVLDQRQGGLMRASRSHLPFGHPEVIHAAFRSKKNTAAFDWRVFHQNFGRWLGRRYNIEKESALSCLLEAQTAVMPKKNQAFPREIKLSHDVMGWYMDRSEGRNKPLTDYAPARMTITEPCYFWRRWQRKNITIEDNDE